MTDLTAWEQRIQQTLADVRRSGIQLARALEKIRGRGEIRGVTVEVNAQGDITNLQIAPGAMRWNNTQLETALLDCHRRARAEAKSKAEGLLHKADPRLQQPMRELLDDTPPNTKTRPRTENEIQAADDAFFERMNRTGWCR
ncbi:YbaB/EbfC family nucleoid-associated protein [Nocardia thraciensis]